MQSPPAATNTTTTTKPISLSDVISRSLQNLFSATSLLRPLPEFLPSVGLERPESVSSAKSRLLTNVPYFRLNYALLLLACALLSLLLHSFFSFLIVSAVILLWLLLYFFREGPLILLDRHVDDQWVIAGLAVGSFFSVCVLGVFWNLVFGAVIGVLLVVAHGACRNGDGLFLSEEEAASQGLVGAQPGSNSVSDRSRTGGV